MPVIPGIVASGYRPGLSAYDNLVLSKASLIGYWRMNVMDDVFYGSLDTIILADSPTAFWKLNALAPVTGGSYDTLVLSHPKLIGYWPMSSMSDITYASLDTVILADSPTAFWKLNAILEV